MARELPTDDRQNADARLRELVKAESEDGLSAAELLFLIFPGFPHSR